ncbi:DUF3531 family protein [Lyngbya sp. CCY1209]|uniref:DUF3531 family protein n=1 Tax=Lyngbya sp. CCY1209 TaxID=2886103 RepID=UPI002D20FFFB|nr:DUF3531 family protein [Lyngbya sp. CCY1209]MEB3884560.1 DUF3531 family protein [Lyngbya sp. CCY1209]
MDVKFRECNPFDIWIWLRFETVPAPMERQYIEEVFDSWFLLGKLGGFNAENLQVQEAGVDLNYISYDGDRGAESLMALMHNMGEVEYQGVWARCWFDLGTSDTFALDVLINAFDRLSREYVVIEELIVGGQNEDWVGDRDRHEPDFVDYN